MKLFIAVNFPEEIRKELDYTAAALRDVAASGHYTPRENYHITLAYLGDCDRSAVKIVETALKTALAEQKKFTIQLGNVNCFPRQDGKIVWVAASGFGQLISMHKSVCLELEKHGFVIPDPDKRDQYVPHITIGKQVDVRVGDLARIPSKPVTFEATSVELMLSSRVHGQVRYSSLYKKKF